jgi:hypothetical protein
MTVTTATEALAGYAFPASAADMAGAYWWNLGRLRGSATRERAAMRVQSLAAAPGQLAAALYGAPGAAPDTHRDPLAWTGIATCLSRLALALHSGGMNFGDRMSLHGGYGNCNWDDLAAAGSRREFAAAWQPVREHLVELAALPGGDGDRQLRGFTVAQVVRAAAAVIGAPW